MSSGCSGDAPAWCWAGPNARRGRRDYAVEMDLVSSRSGFQQTRDFPLYLRHFKGQKESSDGGKKVPNAKGCSQNPFSLWRALFSHLDTLSELRVGKAFCFLPPILFSSSSSASSVMILLCYISFPLFNSKTPEPVFSMRHLGILGPRKWGWRGHLIYPDGRRIYAEMVFI